MSDIGFGPVGDPPIIYDTFTTDGYGRKTPLVDRRLLEQAQARIARLERELRPNSPLRQQADTYHRILRHPEIYRHMRECNKSRSDQIMQRIDALAAERDHWRAEAEKARTPDAGNPAHWRFVADLLEFAGSESDDHQYNGVASDEVWFDARRLRAHADRLESESTADDVVEPYSRDGYNAAQRIENAAREIAKTRGWDWINGPLHHREACWRDARALHSAGLLRGES